MASRFACSKLLFNLLILVILATNIGGQTWAATASGVELPNAPIRQSAPSGSAGDPSMYLPVLMNGYFSLKPSMFGIDFGPISTASGILEMQRAGNFWVRRGPIDWSLVEPTLGARNWDALQYLSDELMTAQQYGFSTILIIQGTPGWARFVDGTTKWPDYSCTRIKDESIPYFAQFMYEIVARYSVPPYNVKYWEIWNEPDIDTSIIFDPSPFGCWGDPDDPYYGGSYYADVLQAVYPKIKEADPAAQVLLGGLLLSCNPTRPGSCVITGGDKPPKYLEGILRHGGANDGGQFFDGISFHAYDRYQINRGMGHYTNDDWMTTETDGPSVGYKADFIRGVLAAYNVQGKYLMETEAGLMCGGMFDYPGGPGCEPTDTSPYEITKAIFLAQNYTVAQAKGLQAVLWYNVFGWRNSGLLYYDRTTPRPAYYAFATAHKALYGAVFTQKITQYVGVDGYEFDLGSGQTLWVLWSKDPILSYLLTLHRLPTAMFNALGTSLPLSTILDVSQMPVYIEWLP